MRSVLPMFLMLIAGLALGSGGSTLYWSGKLDRQFSKQDEWKKLADKQGEAIEMQSSTIKRQTSTIEQQSDALRKLTAATDNYLAAATRVSR